MIEINKHIPKISIITITKNSEKYLEDCIKSVVEQTYKNYEYIIIDGKSIENIVLNSKMEVISILGAGNISENLNKEIFQNV